MIYQIKLVQSQLFQITCIVNEQFFVSVLGLRNKSKISSEQYRPFPVDTATTRFSNPFPLKCFVYSEMYLVFMVSPVPLIGGTTGTKVPDSNRTWLHHSQSDLPGIWPPYSTDQIAVVIWLNVSQVIHVTCHEILLMAFSHTTRRLWVQVRSFWFFWQIFLLQKRHLTNWPSIWELKWFC